MPVAIFPIDIDLYYLFASVISMMHSLGYLVTSVSGQCFPQLCILTFAHIGVADRSSEIKVSIMENITKQSQHDFPLNALQGTSEHYFFIKL